MDCYSSAKCCSAVCSGCAETSWKQGALLSIQTVTFICTFWREWWGFFSSSGHGLQGNSPFPVQTYGFNVLVWIPVLNLCNILAFFFFLNGEPSIFSWNEDPCTESFWGTFWYLFSIDVGFFPVFLGASFSSFQILRDIAGLFIICVSLHLLCIHLSQVSLLAKKV